MKASNASSRRARPLESGVPVEVRQPLTNLRFHVVIEGVPGTGAVEVVLPAARIVGAARGRRAVQFEPMVIRRGLTRSTEWYEWWNAARRTARAPRRAVRVTLLDDAGHTAVRWIFPGSVPVGYSLSPLNALLGAPVIESLELRVGDFALEPSP